MNEISQYYFLGNQIKSIGRNFSQESKRIVALSMVLSNSDTIDRRIMILYHKTFSALFRLTLLAESTHNIQVQVIFYCMLLSISQSIQNNTLLSSHHSVHNTQIIDKKVTVMNALSESIESKPKNNIINVLNNHATNLSDEIQQFHDILREIKEYHTMLSIRIVSISSSVTVLMESIAIVIILLVLHRIYPNLTIRTQFLPLHWQHVTFSTTHNTTILVFLLLLQLIIVIIVVFSGKAFYYIKSLQHKYIQQHIAEVKERIVTVKLLFLEKSSRRHIRYDIPIGTVIAYAGPFEPFVSGVSSISNSPNRSSKSQKHHNHHSHSSNNSPNTNANQTQNQTQNQNQAALQIDTSFIENNYSNSKETTQDMMKELTEYWMPCDGRELSLSDYPELFAILQGSYGKVVGGRFRLPDYRGYFLRGYGGIDPDQSRDMGSIQNDSFRRHNHVVHDPGHNHTWHSIGGSFQSGNQGAYSDFHNQHKDVTTTHEKTGILINYEGGEETRPTNISVNYLIRVKE